MNWDILINAQALAELLPPEHVHFAAPVKEALCIFLAGLSEESQAGVIRAQRALPISATLSERLGRLALSCPVLHKLGQTLAREQRLNIELRRELQKLESLPPTVDTRIIEQTLTQELGPLGDRGVRLEPPALAEASVAVVIPFIELQSAEVRADCEGVFKILKPGVEARLAEELNLLDKIAVHLDDRCEALGIPHLDYQDSFEQVREKLQSELDLEHEQCCLEEAAEFYDGWSAVQIPRLLAHCTPRVTAMTRIRGAKITDCLAMAPLELRRLAALATRALISHPILAGNGKCALFHGDPHAGNLFRTTDGRLAILDWSLAARLPEDERVAINQILLGAVTLRSDKICAALEGLAQRKAVSRAALEVVVGTWLRRIRHGQFPGLHWLVGLLDDAVHNARLRVAGDLMLFRKSLLTLDGVLTELGASALNVEWALVSDFMQQFVKEWPRRWLAAPESRGFRTRLSNLDLAETLLNVPATGVRYWLDESAEMIRRLSVPAPA